VAAAEFIDLDIPYYRGAVPADPYRHPSHAVQLVARMPALGITSEPFWVSESLWEHFQGGSHDERISASATLYLQHAFSRLYRLDGSIKPTEQWQALACYELVPARAKASKRAPSRSR